jgi:hypothetical protein
MLIRIIESPVLSAGDLGLFFAGPSAFDDASNPGSQCISAYAAFYPWSICMERGMHAQSLVLQTSLASPSFTIGHVFFWWRSRLTWPATLTKTGMKDVLYHPSFS